jgi:hypothetical protein
MYRTVTCQADRLIFVQVSLPLALKASTLAFSITTLPLFFTARISPYSIYLILKQANRKFSEGKFALISLFLNRSFDPVIRP